MNILRVAMCQGESEILNKLPIKPAVASQEQFSEDELRKRLNPVQYDVTQQRGTERAFTGKFYRHKDPGVYWCVVCGKALFSSTVKFDTSSGWPAFYDVIEQDRVTLTRDFTQGNQRVEVACASCGSHLGHVFDDGPQPTHLRYCVNSAALSFTSKSDSRQETEL